MYTFQAAGVAFPRVVTKGEKSLAVCLLIGWSWSQQRTYLSWLQTWKASCAVIGPCILTWLKTQNVCIFLSDKSWNYDSHGQESEYKYVLSSPTPACDCVARCSRLWFSQVKLARLPTSLALICQMGKHFLPSPVRWFHYVTVDFLLKAPKSGQQYWSMAPLHLNIPRGTTDLWVGCSC